MPNSITSSQSDEIFTWDSLRADLHQVRSLGYQPLTCKDFYQQRISGMLPRKFIVIRVDIDRSAAEAATMARIFAEENITATFFYRLHAPLYNIFSAESTAAVRAVHQMGFEIGLHCEPVVTAYLTGKAPETVITEDLARLEDLIGDKVHGAASHGDGRYLHLNNLDFWNDHDPAEFGLWYEAYDPETFGLFQMSRYVSDSELTRWKAYDRAELRTGDQRPLSDHLIESDLPLYVLLHPFLFGAKHLTQIG